MKTISMTLAMVMGMTTMALAQPKSATPATPPAATPAKPADKAAPPAATTPAKKPEPPKPPAEVGELAKTLAGTWRCTGKAAMDPTDMTKMTDMKMTMTFKVDNTLGKFWINTTLKSPMFKGTMFTTYDTNKKMWYRVMVDNMGMSQTEWSSGLKDGKVAWEGEMRGMPGVASMKVRTTETMVSPKEVTMLGEGTMDGKTWVKGWEASCKK